VLLTCCALCLQLQQRVSALAADLHGLQLTVSGARAAAAEGSSTGQQLRQQLAAMQEQTARLEAQRAADSVTIQALQAQMQQQLAAMASQQQQRMAAVQQHAAAAAASSSAESAAVVSGAVGLAGEIGDRQAAVLKDLAGLAVEASRYRCVPIFRCRNWLPSSLQLGRHLLSVLAAAAGLQSWLVAAQQQQPSVPMHVYCQ
jgi:hypothetical protein